MQVNFYTDNQQKAATVETFLFTGIYTQMMEGENLSIGGKQYRVNSMIWNDDTRKLLNVFLWEYPAADTKILEDSACTKQIFPGTSRNKFFPDPTPKF